MMKKIQAILYFILAREIPISSICSQYQHMCYQLELFGPAIEVIISPRLSATLALLQRVHFLAPSLIPIFFFHLSLL